MTFNPDRARSKLQTMTNTALENLAREYGVDLVVNGRVASKKRKIAILMQCDAVLEQLGADPGSPADTR